MPYIVESQIRQRKRALRLSQKHVGAKTVVTLTQLGGGRIASLQFAVTGPQYFRRQVSVFEERYDARGATGRRLLGSASWTKQANEPAQPFVLPIERPTQDKLSVEIDNGDNPALRVTEVSAIAELRRIDFPFSPGESLSLLALNP